MESVRNKGYLNNIKPNQPTQNNYSFQPSELQILHYSTTLLSALKVKKKNNHSF